jgi:hypothetical protein
MVNGVTGSGRGRWQRVNGPRPWSGTTVRRLRGGPDDSTGSGLVDDGVGSKEIFGGKFWQPNEVSESLRELGFEMTVKWFIYKGAIVATGIGDIIRAIATENHGSDEWLPSSAHC